MSGVRGLDLELSGEREGQGNGNSHSIISSPEEVKETLAIEHDNESEEKVNDDIVEKNEKVPEERTKMEDGEEKKKGGKMMKFKMSLKKKNVKEEKGKPEGTNDKTIKDEKGKQERTAEKSFKGDAQEKDLEMTAGEETVNQISSGTTDPSKDNERELEKGDKETKTKKDAEDGANSVKKEEKEKSWRGNLRGKLRMFFQESFESESSPSVREDTSPILPETPPPMPVFKNEETNSFDFVSFPEIPDSPLTPTKLKEGVGLSLIKVFDKFYKKSDSNIPGETESVDTPAAKSVSPTLCPLSDKGDSHHLVRPSSLPLGDTISLGPASSDDDHEDDAIFRDSDGSEPDHPVEETDELSKVENQSDDSVIDEEDEGPSDVEEKKQKLNEDDKCDEEHVPDIKVEETEDQGESISEEGKIEITKADKDDREGEVVETGSLVGVEGNDASNESAETPPIQSSGTPPIQSSGTPPIQPSGKTGLPTPTGSSSIGFKNLSPCLSSFRKLGRKQKESDTKPTDCPEGPQEPQTSKEELTTKTANQGKETKEGLSKVVQLLQRGGSRLAEQQRRLKSQIWSSVVTIVLVEGKNLLPMDSDGTSDPYVKFRLGNEKYKSKTELRTLSPRWVEQFDFHLFEDQSQVLEITVWDKDARTKDDFMGRCNLDLSQYEREQTHHIWVELEDGAGSIFLLFTISGTTSAETISDLHTYQENPREEQIIRDRYKLRRSLHSLRDIGFLKVKVYRAQGLASADIGGKSDPFCVLELINSRLQTQTEYKTLSPCWNKIFTFNVKDIHSVLEITVYDEDRDHKVEFLGKIAIPLLKIKDNEKKWYALKDKKLRARAKGNHPEILLECSVVWNTIRAAIRTFTPKEDKFMQQEQKFKRQVFIRNVNRLRSCILCFIELGKFVKSCWDWESPVRSVAAFVVFLVVTYCFEVYMLPIMLLLLFLRNYIQRWTMSKVISLVGSVLHREEDSELSGDEEDIDDEDKDKTQNPEEEKKSLKERLQAIQEVTATVQNAIGFIASIGESCKNTFNFSVPFLSWLAIICLAVGAVLLYYIPVRYLVMLWGINKFSRQLLRPHSMVNNELLDFLSRVPDDEELKDYRELRPVPHFPDDRRRDARKKKNL